MDERIIPNCSVLVSFDKDVVNPGEDLNASVTIINNNPYPIFIGSSYWYFSCYPNHFPDIDQTSILIPANSSKLVSSWRMPIPSVPQSQYEVLVSFDLYIWDVIAATWINMGRTTSTRKEKFHIIHNPRFKAFVSRSNHDVDRPIVESINSVIKHWGFQVDTLGINFFESDPGKETQRIIEEIKTSDIVFAIATPRDISSNPNLFRTFTWIHNEVAFGFIENKPILLISEENIILDGLIRKIPTIKYSMSSFPEFLSYLHSLMPQIRKILEEHNTIKLAQQINNAIEQIRFESILAGMVIQKRLLTGNSF